TVMRECAEIQALAGRGLEGDRYCERRGYWTNVDECQVTLIAAEDLDAIARDLGVAVGNGEHRRNLVVRGIDLESLSGQRFRVGAAAFAFDRPRPPCSYIAALTDRRMTKALWGRGGICARVVTSGVIRRGDALSVGADVPAT
ncbi:MAG: MOSC domain-containing protein, partial [Alphaproteobacteria bacterium]|nr:MOSC domain-containing protein [Alphaproteobacteria bacterium]